MGYRRTRKKKRKDSEDEEEESEEEEEMEVDSDGDAVENDEDAEEDEDAAPPPATSSPRQERLSRGARTRANVSPRIYYDIVSFPNDCFRQRSASRPNPSRNLVHEVERRKRRLPQTMMKMGRKRTMMMMSENDLLVTSVYCSYLHIHTVLILLIRYLTVLGSIAVFSGLIAKDINQHLIFPG